jgi:4-O-beta-D-mannosyl-D-glucose phosphorylase
VATTTVEKLVDYCLHTPEDALRSAACVQQRLELARSNQAYFKANGTQLD